MTRPLVLTLDVGSSSVRTLLFDGAALQVEGIGAQLPYELATTPDGGVEVGADELADLAVASLATASSQLSERGIRPDAVAFCTFWHNVLGVDGGGRPTTPVIHLFDTRSTAAARELAARVDARAQHSRTGCVIHPSYLPAKLLWLSQAQPEAFRSTRRWMSFGEYLFLKLFGNPVSSVSMMSGSGLWDQNASDYDEGILSVLPIDRGQLAAVADMDQPQSNPAGLAALGGIPWFPAFGDGACNNIGSGCITPDRFALMVGTSGAMRAVAETGRIEIPEGLWCYRADRRRFVLGGALSNGGEVFAWMKRTLALPPESELEALLSAMPPGGHGLTILPLFAGERSTKWRADARAAFFGMSMHTQPIDLLRAALEAVALRFRNIYDLMSEQLGVPAGVVATGGALLRSPAWTQMMADALGRPVIASLEAETSSRGAALLVLERIGAIGHIRDLRARVGGTVAPIEANRPAYDQLLRKQRWLYAKLFEEN